MKLLNQKLLLRSFAFVVAMGMVASDAKAQTQIFTNPSDNFYRIPSIIRLLDNSLWAFADYRHNGNGDLGNHRIDIYGKKSTDDGKNWDANPSAVVIGDDNASGENEYKYAYGDPSTVVDRESGKVLMLTASGKKTIWNAGYPIVGRHLYDNGIWITSNVSSTIFGPDNSYTSSLFATSGKMIQSTVIKAGAYYRVYSALCCPPGVGSRVVYSDDFGVTWHYLGGTTANPVTDGDECKVEELPDGSILLSTRVRTGSGRHFNVFKYTDKVKGTGSWQSNYVTSGATDASDQTYATQCNGELLLVPAKNTSGKQTYVLLLSAPNNNNGPGRIYWKELPEDYTNLSNYVSGWNRYVASSAGLSFGGYSTMVLDQKGNIALLTENERYGKGIKFTSLSLATITSNAFSYSPSPVGAYHTSSEPFSPGAYKAPTFSVNGGTYSEAKSIVLSNDDKNVTIYYTLDGSDPVVLAPASSSSSSAKPKRVSAVKGTQVYTAPIELSEGATILKAISADANGNHSAVVSASYNIVTSSSTSTTTTQKTGTTISMDNKSASPLFYSGAYGPAAKDQPFSYLRHNNSHVQLVAATRPARETGADYFDATVNNIGFLPTGTGTDSLLALYNGSKYSNGGTPTRFGHFAVIAPKGYRFMRFQIVLDGSNAAGYSLARYDYDASGNVNPLDSVVSVSGQDVTFDKTLDNGGNLLYFRVNLGNTNVNPVKIKSFRLTYAIDSEFSAEVPNSNGSSIHVGLVDLGTFTNNKDNVVSGANGGNGYWSYNADNVSDLQAVNVRKGDNSEVTTITVDNKYYYVAPSEGYYYVEAPAKFRIIGATVKVKSAGFTVGNYANYTPSTSSNGDKVIFQSSSGSVYLKMNENGVGKSTDTKDDATRFTVNYTSSGYTLTTDDGKYLYMNEDGEACHLSETPTYWKYTNGSYQYTITKSDKSTMDRYLIYSASSGKWGYSYKTDEKSSAQSVPTTYTATKYSATVFNREGTQEATNGTVSVEQNVEQSYELSDFNNDAIKLSFPNLPKGSAALFNVTLKLLPLNPEIPTIQAASMSNGKVVGNYQVTSLNYDFNNGSTVRVPVLATDDANTDYTMVFRNANNEERTLWYTTGSNSNNLSVKGGYSNYYLLGSHADTDLGMNLTDNSTVPEARTGVDQAGDRFIPNTNTKTVGGVNFLGTGQIAAQTDANSRIVDKTVTKTDAGYATVTMKTSDTEKTVYIYSADVPTYRIMPEALTRNNHIDFRSFTIKVKPVRTETPVIQLVTIYDKTFKSDLHKTPIAEGRTYNDKGTQDTQHKFVGVKVTSQAEEGQTVYGALTAQQIFTSLREALKTYPDYNQWFSDDPQTIDALRGVLYVDMSALTSVSIDNNTKSYMDKTADNCLFFMPEGFAGSNLPNCIGKFGSDYNAIGNITVYDQQPFFSPYDFKTATYSAIYNREGTVNGMVDTGSRLAKVGNMAAVLPFNIPLNGSGHPFTTTDVANTNITFFTITNSGAAEFRNNHNVDVAFAVQMSAVTDNTAKANHPYYVKNENSEGGFSFNISGAQFAKTGDVTYATTSDANGSISFASLTGDGQWVPTGTYSGQSVSKTETNWSRMWYFSNNYFWNAGKLQDNTHFNVRPFRAYYTSPEVSTAKVAAVVFDPSEFISTGISTIYAGSEDYGKIYTLDGRYVGTSFDGLAPGLYIQNGRKVVKQ